MFRLSTTLFALWTLTGMITGQRDSYYIYTTTPYICDDPDPVTDLAVDMSSYSSFKLTWTNPSNITQRCIHAYNVTVVDGDGSLVCSHSVWQGFYVNDNIYPCLTTVCTNYTASVFVVGYPAVSRPTFISFYTGAAKVRNLAASNTMVSETHLTWRSPDTLTCAKHYKLYACAYNSPAEQDCLYQTSIISLNKTSFLLAGLESCKNNHIWLATVDEYGGENNVSVTVHTGDGYPPKVRAGSVVLNQGYSVSVSWNPTSDFKQQCHAGYRVCSISDRDGSKHCYFTSKTTYDVRPLTACTNYTISVQTVDGLLREDSQRSEEYLLRVFTNPAIPTTTVLAGTAQMSQMLFEKPDNYSSSCLSHYEMEECVERPVTGGGCEELHHDVLPVNISSYNSSMLTDCSTSNLIFYAVGKNGGKSYLDFKYINDQGALHPLSNLTLISVSTKHVSLAWTPSDFNDCPHSYRVCFYLNKYRTCGISSMETGDTFRNISLRACSDYSAKVWLMHKKQTSTSLAVDFQTGPENADQQSVQLTPNSALVTWARDTSARRCTTGYSITWCPASNFSDTCGESPTGSVTVPDTTTRYIITGLETCVEYLLVFQARGRNDSLVSEPNATFIQPPMGKFGNITDLAVHQSENNTVVLDIVFPNNTSKCITKFTTCLYEADTEEPDKYCRLMKTQWVNMTQSCTKYTVDVMAVAYDQQTANGSVSFQTGAAPVSDVVAKVSSSGEAVAVTWTFPDSNVQCVSYQRVTFIRRDDGETFGRNVSKNDRSAEYGGLQLCRSYDIEVQPITLGSVSPPDVAVQIHTPSNVRSLSSLNVTGTSQHILHVAYNIAEVTSYCVGYFEVCWQAHGGKESCTNNTGHTSSSVNITGLSAATNYTVHVTPVSPEGERYVTTTTTASTLPSDTSNCVTVAVVLSHLLIATLTTLLIVVLITLLIAVSTKARRTPLNLSLHNFLHSIKNSNFTKKVLGNPVSK